VKDVSLTGFKYEPKMKIMPCKSLSFHFVLTVNNSDEVELYIRKEDKNDYIYTFTINSETETIEKSDLTTLIQTIGETLKDKFSGKSLLIETIENGKSYVGMIVRMSDSSVYKRQAYMNDGNGFGAIIDYLRHEDYGSSEDHIFIVLWNNGISNVYRLKDLEFEEEKPIEKPKVKWYKGGKFIKELFKNDDSILNKEV
jgi:hypothetical protein